jgi:hypothetical protein
MDPAVAVPPLHITSEIRNNYTCPTPDGDHTILVLHLAAYGQFLSARLTIPGTVTVRTILAAVWEHWSGPSEDPLPLPSWITLFSFRDLTPVGWFSLKRLSRSQHLSDIDHCRLFLLTVRRSSSVADVEASLLLRDQAMKNLVMSWWFKPDAAAR